MNILMIGDIVGKPGRKALTRLLPSLMDEVEAHLVIVNAENAAGGFGMSTQIYEKLTGLGVDVMTSGNHIWDRRDFMKEIDDCERVIRPANFAPGVPGKGHIIIETDMGPAAVVNLEGRVYMPPVDCPFRAADQVLSELDKDVKVVIVDLHAEATSEKEAMGYYLDGRVTAVLGTHTHVVTADERVLKEGTAFISDVGMTGPRDSVIGVKVEPVLERFLKGIPRRFDTANGPVDLHAVLIKADAKTGKAKSIERVKRSIES